MISPRAFRFASTIAVILSSIGIFAVGLVLVSRADTHCFHFAEPWFVGLGASLFVLSLVGLFFLWRIYPRCYVIYMIGVSILALAHVAALIYFWTLVAAPHDRVEAWWMRHYLPDEVWSDVRQCMRRTDFCGRVPDFQACCDEPAGCLVPDAVVDRDCSLWADTHDIYCYSCRACRLAIVHQLRDDGRQLQPALIVFICFLLLVVIGSAVELHRRGIALFVAAAGDGIPEEQPGAGDAEGGIALFVAAAGDGILEEQPGAGEAQGAGEAEGEQPGAGEAQGAGEAEGGIALFVGAAGDEIPEEQPGAGEAEGEAQGAGEAEGGIALFVGAAGDGILEEQPGAGEAEGEQPRAGEAQGAREAEGGQPGVGEAQGEQV